MTQIFPPAPDAGIEAWGRYNNALDTQARKAANMRTFLHFSFIAAVAAGAALWSGVLEINSEQLSISYHPEKFHF